MSTNPIRDRNKALGRLCGNCGNGVDTSDPKYVHCMEVAKNCNCKGERCWYRRKKGGCAKWCEKTNTEENDNARPCDT